MKTDAGRFRPHGKRVGLICILIAVACTVPIALYNLGFGLTAEQATRTNRDIHSDSALLASVAIGEYEVFFYENEGQFDTVSARRHGLLWQRDTGSYWAKKTQDPVRLVGWMSQGDETGAGITAVPVRNFDERVAYIAMGPDIDRITQDVPTDGPVVFAWERLLRWNDLEGIACSEDGTILYRLGYEVTNGRIQPEDLRWLPAEMDREIVS